MQTGAWRRRCMPPVTFPSPFSRSCGGPQQLDRLPPPSAACAHCCREPVTSSMTAALLKIGVMISRAGEGQSEGRGRCGAVADPAAWRVGHTDAGTVLSRVP